MAKIPIILEAGRADGKLISSGAIFDENKGMFQSEINDIQDTLNSDNPNKPLSAKQGKVLKELLDTKVIETVANLIDTKPTEGNTTHIVSSDGLAKEFNKCNTTIINTDRIANEAIVLSKLSVDIQNLITNLNKNATFAGIATPTTNPSTPDGPIFYIANGKGTYSNFDGIVVTEDEVIFLYYDSAWRKVVTGIASQDRIYEIEEEIYGIGKSTQPKWESGRISNGNPNPITNSNFVYCYVENIADLYEVHCVGKYEYNTSYGGLNPILLTDASNTCLMYCSLNSATSDSINTPKEDWITVTDEGYNLDVKKMLEKYPNTSRLYLCKYVSAIIEWYIVPKAKGEGILPFINRLRTEPNALGVTKEQIGLSDVDNTSDEDKPISRIAEDRFKSIEKVIGINDVVELFGDWVTGRLTGGIPTPNTNNYFYFSYVDDINKYKQVYSVGKFEYVTGMPASNPILLADSNNAMLMYSTIYSSMDTLNNPRENWIIVTNDGYILDIKKMLQIYPTGYRLYLCKPKNRNVEWYKIKKSSGGLVEKLNNLKEDVNTLKEDVTDIPEIVFPSKAVSVVGHEWNMYFDNVVKGFDNRYYINIRIVIQSTNKTYSFSTRAKMYSDCLRITPSVDDIGIYNIIFDVCKRNSGKIIATKTLILNVIDDIPLTNKHVIFIGDSLTDNSIYPVEIQYKLSKGGIISVGTKSNTKAYYANLYDKTDTQLYTIYNEGRGGWATDDYVYNYQNDSTSTNPEDVDGNKAINPFFNETLQTEQKFDFSYYMRNNNFSNIDVVCIGLGTNGSRKGNDVDNIKWMINSIHAYNPNIKVIIALTAPPSTQNGVGRHNNLQCAEELHLEFFKQRKSYIEAFDEKIDNVSVCELYFNLDRKNDYKEVEVTVSARNPKTFMCQDNNVHPNDYGYLKFADMYYNNILYQLTK